MVNLPGIRPLNRTGMDNSHTYGSRRMHSPCENSPSSVLVMCAFFCVCATQIYSAAENTAITILCLGVPSTLLSYISKIKTGSQAQRKHGGVDKGEGRRPHMPPSQATDPGSQVLLPCP